MAINQTKDKGAVPPQHQWRTLDRYVLVVTLGDAGAVYAIVHAYNVREPQSVAQPFFDLRHLQRMPASKSLAEIVEDVCTLMQRPPLNHDGELVVDETQAGAAMVDLFAKAGLKPIRAVLTAGGVEQMNGTRRYEIPRASLISTVRARLHANEFRIAADLHESPSLEAAMRNLRHALEPATPSAGEDLIVAAGLALWRAGKRRPNFGGRREHEVRVGYAHIKQKFGLGYRR